MNVRLCTIEDLDEVSKLAHRCNRELGQSSSFMYSELIKVHTSFMDTIHERSIQIGAFQADQCLGYIHIVNDANYVPGDVLGPFVPSEDKEIARSLILSAFEHSKDITKFKFNIGINNFLVKLMPDLGAIEREHNYSLKISRDKFDTRFSSSVGIEVTIHSSHFDEQFERLFNVYFDDSYLTAQDVLSYDISRYRLVDLVVESVFCGFCFYRPQDGYIDFLAINENCQRKGFGKYLLQSAIGQIFSSSSVNDIVLDVDLSSKDALKLYSSLGFQIESEFVSFHLKISSDNVSICEI